jgi:hypothetical protein
MIGVIQKERDITTIYMRGGTLLARQEGGGGEKIGCIDEKNNC